MNNTTKLTTLEGGLDEVNPSLEYPLAPGDRYYYDGADYSFRGTFEDPDMGLVDWSRACVGGF